MAAVQRWQEFGSKKSRVRIRNIANKTTEEQEVALEDGAKNANPQVSNARLRSSQSREQRQTARETVRLAMLNRRANLRGQLLDNFRRARRDYSSIDCNGAACRYDCNIEYSSHASVRIGTIMNVVCEH
ncbi:hypothetical protein J6590_023752 [Homalodisca vitripennis]|nr:hypothetical protein J6590_023752 [Homalodisca vitripennis]